MRQLIFTLVILLPSLLFGQNSKIEWISLNEAAERMEKEPRKVLVDVYTSWCGPCKMMDQNTFQNPDVVEYINDHFYAIKFNAESPESIEFKGNVYQNANHDPTKRGRNSTHDLARVIAPVNGRIAYPTVVYMDESFKILAPVQGYHTPQQIEPILKFIGEGSYESMNFADFKTDFTPTFE